MSLNNVSQAAEEETAKLKKNKEQQAKGGGFLRQNKRRSNNAPLRNYRNMYFSLYESADDGRWYWSIRTDDNQTVATGGQGYINREDARNSVNEFKKNMPGLKVYDESQKEWLK
jgi:uncharacterized protein YegP (UPF0339 family)